MAMKLSRTCKILLLGANIWYFGEGMMGPLFAIFAERVGGNILDITWAWATYLMVTGVLYILVGRLLARKGNLNREGFKEKVLVLGYCLNAVFTFGYLFVHSSIELFFVQAGLGVAEAIGTPAWDALYAKNINPEVQPYAWGLSTGQAQIVSGLAFILGGLIAHFISFAALFITMGVIQGIAALITSQILIRRSNST